MPKRRTLVVLTIIALLGGVFLAGRASKAPVPLPVLPPEVIIETIVKEIPVPVEIRVEVPGPIKIVEKIKWKTREVEVPFETIRTVTEVVERAADLGSLSAQVQIDALKFEGLHKTKVKYGWRGTADCSIRAGTAGPWTTLVREPFSLEGSTAITTEAPKDRRPFPWRLDLRLGANTAGELDFGTSFHRRSRFGFYFQGQWNPNAESFSFDPRDDDFYFDQSPFSFSEDDFRLALGVEFTIGRNK